VAFPPGRVRCVEPAARGRTPAAVVRESQHLRAAERTCRRAASGGNRTKARRPIAYMSDGGGSWARWAAEPSVWALGSGRPGHGGAYPRPKRNLPKIGFLVWPRAGFGSARTQFSAPIADLRVGRSGWKGRRVGRCPYGFTTICNFAPSGRSALSPPAPRKDRPAPRWGRRRDRTLSEGRRAAALASRFCTFLGHSKYPLGQTFYKCSRSLREYRCWASPSTCSAAALAAPPRAPLPPVRAPGRTSRLRPLRTWRQSSVSWTFSLLRR
jgi:hypothetical protein